MQKLKNTKKYAKISDTPFDQRSLFHQEAWFPHCFERQNQQKKLFFLFGNFTPFPNKIFWIWDTFKISENLVLHEVSSMLSITQNWAMSPFHLAENATSVDSLFSLMAPRQQFIKKQNWFTDPLASPLRADKSLNRLNIVGKSASSIT